MTNKDLIKQYVNTGLSIPEHQVNQLNNNDLNSYLRVRLIAAARNGVLYGYEFRRFHEDARVSYLSTSRITKVVRLLSNEGIKTRYLTAKSIVETLKHELNINLINDLLDYTPKENEYDLVKDIFPYVKDRLDTNIISELLHYTPRDSRYEMVKQIIPYVKDKLVPSIFEALVQYTPKEQKDEISNLLSRYI